jgi:DNA invertase Pin-like site-specific DNA recombinase
MTIYGYTRVSTGKQAKEGESLDVQMRQLAGYAAMNGWELAETFREEGVSGSVPLAERPEGKRLLGKLRAGDVIIAPKLDRIFRSALDALQMVESLKRQGVALHLLDLGGDISGNGLSKLFLTIVAAVAEAERDRIAERVATVKADQRKRGRYLGGLVPYGFQVGAEGALEPVPEQQAVIGKAKALRAEGASLRAIRAALADEGVQLSLDAINRISQPVEG